MIELLTGIEKPGRYTGEEWGAVIKQSPDVSICLIYPDLYEVGMSNLGQKVIYEIANNLPFASAERAYLPGVDMCKRLRRLRRPLCSLETRRPIFEFDLLGFTLEYELNYTNVLEILDLGGIPILAQKRRDKDPIVIAGGTSTYNPYPLLPVFDAFVIGEGEEVIVEMLELMKGLKGAERGRKLKGLNEIQGVWVPLFGRKRVRRRWVEELNEKNHPVRQIVPNIEVIHDRFTIEVSRGCTRGCRFCQAGYIYRPVRERSTREIIDIASEGLQFTGWDELSLLSFSLSDHTGFPDFIIGLKERFPDISISLSSIRGDAITDEIAEVMGRGRKTTITIAPEAGTERLRNIINKDIKDDDIFMSLEIANRYGWNHMKLYFMVGLPGETEEDVIGISRLLNRISGRIKYLNVRISPFVPRPFTPFEYYPQEGIETLKRKKSLIYKNLKARNVNVKFRNPEIAFIEGILTRGDEGVFHLIERAWRKELTHQAWGEFFDFAEWKRIIEETGVDIERIMEGGSRHWDNIDCGVGEKYLKVEMKKAERGIITPDCITGCTGCLACPGDPEVYRKPGEYVSVRIKGKKERRLYRITYRKRRPFYSHMDCIRAVVRGIRRSGVRPAVTEGYNPRPRMHFSPALPLDFTSEEEFIYIHVYGDIKMIPVPDFIEIRDIEEVEKVETYPYAVYGLTVDNFDEDRLKQVEDVCIINSKDEYIEVVVPSNRSVKRLLEKINIRIIQGRRIGWRREP